MGSYRDASKSRRMRKYFVALSQSKKSTLHSTSGRLDGALLTEWRSGLEEVVVCNGRRRRNSQLDANARAVAGEGAQRVNSDGCWHF